MITTNNLKQVLQTLGFKSIDKTILTKTYDNNAKITVDCVNEPIQIKFF